MGHSSYAKYDNIEQGIIIINKGGEILYKNKQSNTILGCDIKGDISNFIGDIDAIQNSKNISILLKVINITVVPKNKKHRIVIIKDFTDKLVYEEFFNITKHFICITKSDGSFTKVNPCMIEKLGYSQNYFQNRKFLQLVHLDDWKRVYDEISTLDENKQTCNVICRFTKSTGDYMYLNWDIKYINKASLFYFSNDVTDIMEVKAELETSKIFLNTTEDLIVSGCWDWDIDTGNLIWSDGLKNIYEIDDVTYDNYFNQNHQEDREIIQNTINKCLIDKKPYTITHRVVGAKSGKIKYLKARGIIIDIFNRKKLIGVGQDVTDIIMNEKSLVDLKDKAIKNDNIKSQFIANVSHELRTPLNGIIGITELLKSSKGLTDKQMEYIDTLDNSCGMLLSIINNVLDFSKLEKEESHVEISRVNFRDFIQHNTKLFRFNIERKKLYLNLVVEPEVPEFVDLDEIKVKQIVYNLLSNAFKFTSIGGITLRVFIKGNNLNIEVKDTGIGIEEDKQKNIFEPFNQADQSTTRKYGGTGLGLSICREYAKLLNGTIYFTSKFKVGSIFCVSLPINSPDSQSIQGSCVYIVEDNISNQYILKEIIRDYSQDISVECFENGKICIDNIKQEEPPLVVFMDLHMPIMDGYTCTTMLRDIGIKCPIVGVTANHMSNEKLKCLKTGMNDFLLKPINSRDIHDILDKYKVA
jgi:PAS domain S-box-containing protein